MNDVRRQSSGFSLIEVLVALLLICIGVLGMVAMQGRTVQYTQDSVQRSTAAMLANEMLETMRSNRDQVYTASGNLNPNSAYFTGSDGYPKAPEEGSCQPLPANANPAEQINCWLTRVQETLPGASGLAAEVHVCRAGSSAGTCGSAGRAIEIQVAWRVKSGECMDAAADSDSDPTICRYRVRAEI
ncbi:type IV pilus modification protein PilV [Pseudomonas citronellolis]|uniref:type IV pilus modification protein PilV n=1 Tax=Pseudomonas citronellolis TaxID=53408 RepID=UPI00248DBF50|nr:type IV pilus modification protein PilV [Pseudomonas citronellolis]